MAHWPTAVRSCIVGLSAATVLHSQARPAIVEPSWPAPFEIGPGEATGFGFSVGAPGPVKVSVQCQGAAIVLTLVRPGGSAIERPGNCGAVIDAAATQEDVRRGVIWRVGIRPASSLPDAARASSTVRDRAQTLVVRPVVSGSIVVQHPPSDAARAQAEFNTMTRSLPAPSVAVATGGGVAAQRAADTEREAVARRTRLAADLKGARTAPPAPPTPTKPSAVALEKRSAPVLAISALSINQGLSFDPVRLTGTELGDLQGEVHFVFPSGKDLKARIDAWTSSSVDFVVPSAPGEMETVVQVYAVKPGTGRTATVPFTYKPTIEYRTLILDLRSGGSTTTGPNYCGTGPNDVCTETVYYATGYFLGAKGNDSFFTNLTLKNGWVVDRTYLVPDTKPQRSQEVTGVWATPTVWGGVGPGAGAYITESGEGTASTAIKVHWWLEPAAHLSFSPRVLIRGPLGLPHN